MQKIVRAAWLFFAPIMFVVYTVFFSLVLLSVIVIFYIYILWATAAGVCLIFIYHLFFEVPDGPVEKYAREESARVALDKKTRAALVCVGAREKDEYYCFICREDTAENDFFAVLPCKHAFHAACVGESMALRATCPRCRESVGVAQAASYHRVGNTVSDMCVVDNNIK